MLCKEFKNFCFMGVLLANPLIIVGSLATLFLGCSVIDLVKYFCTGHYEFSCFFVITAIPEFLKGFIGGFADFFFKRQSPKKPFVLTQAMIEAVKQKSSEDWVALLCVKDVNYAISKWEKALNSSLNYYSLLNKAFQPFPQAVTYEAVSQYYDSIGDPHKEVKLEVLANLYTPLKYKDVFSSDNPNQNADDFQLALEMFARRLKACSVYNKKWVFGKAPIPFNQVYGDVVNKDYLTLVLKNEIEELDKCQKHAEKMSVGEIKPVGISKENHNILFFRCSPTKRHFVISEARQKLDFLRSIEGLDNQIQALIQYEHDRPF